MTTIIRNALAFEKDFVRVPNLWMRDARLSRRARGLLAELMSHESGYSITTSRLAATGLERRDAIRSTLTELLQAGYLTRTIHRSGGGKFTEQTYELCDPFAGDAFPGPGESGAGEGGPFKKTKSKKTKSLEDKESKEHSANARRGHSTRPGSASPEQRQYLDDIADTLEWIGDSESAQSLLRDLSNLSSARANELIDLGWSELEQARFKGSLYSDARLRPRIRAWLLRGPGEAVRLD